MTLRSLDPHEIYEGEPMNPWLEFIFANITVATLRSFLEFLGLLAGSR